MNISNYIVTPIGPYWDVYYDRKVIEAELFSPRSGGSFLLVLRPASFAALWPIVPVDQFTECPDALVEPDCVPELSRERYVELVQPLLSTLPIPLHKEPFPREFWERCAEVFLKADLGAERSLFIAPRRRGFLLGRWPDPRTAGSAANLPTVGKPRTLAERFLRQLGGRIRKEN